MDAILNKTMWEAAYDRVNDLLSEMGPDDTENFVIKLSNDKFAVFVFRANQEMEFGKSYEVKLDISKVSK